MQEKQKAIIKRVYKKSGIDVRKKVCKKALGKGRRTDVG